MEILIKLFISFLKVGLFSVGGGYAAIPLIQNQIVDVYHLMSIEEFADLITIAEMTPGPISLNSSTFVGNKLAGIPGAVLASIACIIPSFLICLTLAYFYYKYRNFKGVQTVLESLRPAVVALIASAGLTILVLGLFQSDKAHIALSNFRPVEAILFLVSLLAIRKWKVSPIMIIFGSGIVGTILYQLL